ncbi:hypothetical protein [Dysgonomonas sp. 216]|uniref:hypothetical protein n=1 Tax=Dysgonomonas sp. 216 TaxID=2302934 RepID=UPI0013D19B43|nr:hypothetical protein [Dysgonomonas sp. 216]
MVDNYLVSEHYYQFYCLKNIEVRIKKQLFMEEGKNNKDKNAFEQVNKSLLNEKDIIKPKEATEKEVEEANDRINIDKNLSDRG